MKYFLLPFLALCLGLLACGPSPTPNPPESYTIIPRPASLIPQDGQFSLIEKTHIRVHHEAKSFQSVADYLSEILKQVEYSSPTKDNKTGREHPILFEFDPDIQDEEAYELSVSPDRVLITASHPHGAFYAVQTLRQLLNMGKIPAVEIKDSPRFPYRGMHLDVARHFFDIEAVKRYIDQMAYHKLNRFHWHLTEDQGWRIEIKKYPKLTETGAFRNGTLIGHYNDQPHRFDGKRYGGFYTQEEIREVVTYAAARFITIVPEIEMPGHAQAAIAAYPELGCTGQQLEVWQLWGVSQNVFCPTEETFAFLEDVLKEVIDLFPGKYIHIGGDECPKKQWKESAFCQELMKQEGLADEHELQSYFIKRIEGFVNSKGRQLIGWDEILEGGLAPNAAVMSWRGTQGGIEAAEAGHDVVMTPTSHCYLDYYQSDHPEEPLAIGGLIPLEKVYSYEPIPDQLAAEAHKHILGAQVNLWTEYIPTVNHLDYMVFPRLCAMAEVVWSPAEIRDFDDFVRRLAPHIERLQAMGFNSANHLYEIKSGIQADKGKVNVTLNIHAKDGEIHYTLDGSEPGPASPLYTNPLEIDSSSIIRAQAFRENEAQGRVWEQAIQFHLATGKAIRLTHPPHDKYAGGGSASLLNGVPGSDERYGDMEWLGFSGQDFEAVIDLEAPTALHEISFRFFNGEGQWIYLPKAVQVWVSADGESYQKAANTESIEGTGKVVEVGLSLEGKVGRYLKVFAKNHGLIAEGKQGAGYEAWLFVDEIRVD